MVDTDAKPAASYEMMNSRGEGACRGSMKHETGLKWFDSVFFCCFVLYTIYVFVFTEKMNFWLRDNYAMGMTTKFAGT